MMKKIATSAIALLIFVGCAAAPVENEEPQPTRGMAEGQIVHLKGMTENG